MRFRISGVLIILTTGLLLAQSGTTADNKAKPPTQSEKSTKMVGFTKMDDKTVFATKGSTWKVLNADKLTGHEGRAVEITGTFNAQRQTVHIETVNDIACGPRLCERKCEGKCGNGNACDCDKI